MKQGWIQSLGGLAILLIVPVLTVLCLSPDFYSWVEASIASHSRSEKAIRQIKDGDVSDLIKQYRLPNAISTIAKVSEAEPDFSKAAPVQSSELSRAVFRLQRALQAYPAANTKDIFHAANNRERSAKTAPCPFERISDEQSIMLTEGKRGASLTETLNRCAAAVEQGMDQER